MWTAWKPNNKNPPNRTFFPCSPSVRLELKCTFMLVNTRMDTLAQNDNFGMVKSSAHWLHVNVIWEWTSSVTAYLINSCLSGLCGVDLASLWGPLYGPWTAASNPKLLRLAVGLAVDPWKWCWRIAAALVPIGIPSFGCIVVGHVLHF